jgi:hypothetical protein
VSEGKASYQEKRFKNDKKQQNERLEMICRWRPLGSKQLVAAAACRSKEQTRRLAWAACTCTIACVQVGVTKKYQGLVQNVKVVTESSLNVRDNFGIFCNSASLSAHCHWLNAKFQTTKNIQRSNLRTSSKTTFVWRLEIVLRVHQ